MASPSGIYYIHNLSSDSDSDITEDEYSYPLFCKYLIDDPVINENGCKNILYYFLLYVILLIVFIVIFFVY